MDKSWMFLEDKLCDEYRNGMERFLEFAFQNSPYIDKILCPCTSCGNILLKSKDDVRYDLIKNGMMLSYTVWFHHGEQWTAPVAPLTEVNEQSTDDSEDCDGMYTMLEEGLLGDSGMLDDDDPNKGVKTFYDLLEDAKKSLYPGCTEFSRLSFVLKLLHLKCLYGWSDKSVTSLLELLKKALPKGETLPSSYREARNMIKDLGLDYKKIHSCPSNCILFWKEYANLDTCVKCGCSRWKSEVTRDDGSKKKIAAKVLRYFPLKPRLQRLFMSSKTAFDMRWHEERRTKDGLLRHPADTLAWKRLDGLYPLFASEPRNVRLGLASDGFNPFGTMSSSYSTWPVVLVPYNLPPWMCMKKPFVMLSLLIPGPKAPGDSLDVYLQPLVEELKELWEVGVETYDASKKENFKMHAAVLWTISDFPAYGNLSGWSTKGKWACPYCNKDTWHLHLKNSHKLCYMGHRRWLKMNHRWRQNKIVFDGTVEKRDKPQQLSGEEILEQLHIFDRGNSGPIEDKNDWRKQWKKKSIFFELPYWKYLLLRHNLDVMHIEKNLCESLIGTLLNIDGKTKDGAKARRDLEQLHIRKELHLKNDEKSGRIKKPPALITLSPDERLKLCQFLKEIKLPDGLGSNIARCVNVKERKIHSLKSHDCHMLIQLLLPMALCDLFANNVSQPLIQLCNFFRELCSKVLRVEVLEALESQIVEILCKLEMVFPPSFFDIMVHLPIHLAWEAKIAGPVHYRWMYPIERYLRTLKSYVRNKSKPEGSIAEGYIAEECLTFCSRYLDGIETRFNRAPRNYDGCGQGSSEGISVFVQSGRVLGKGIPCELSREDWLQAHLYVLKNCDEAQPYIKQYEEMIASTQHCTSDLVIKTKFLNWFESQVTLSKLNKKEVNNQLYALACGPTKNVLSYKGCVINGFRFHTKDQEKEMQTQNSGVFVKGETNVGSIDYYGVLTYIFELQYLGGNRILLFKCDWLDVYGQDRGIKFDAHGFTYLNFNRLLSTTEPFILACQAEQVFYVKEMRSSNWYFVQKSQPRDFYDLKSMEEVLNGDAFQENEQVGDQGLTHASEVDGEVDNVVTVWNRTDIPEEVVNESKAPRQLKKRKRRTRDK